ncbi:hypothetical protein RQP54_13190 [Curvibacter sp. APW13]|uniref:hypothetical protein n=1 Tax=Curvibacter sp. APW13 TaxID=3077236 RepID=UPI0028DDE2DB|nr:hypothetical protein [Curvibacter sp. APW13]MDT8991819.1 hypothetical protein [Curvibacter sp. APW13]
MTWIVDHIKGLMLLAGALTSTMLLAAIAPHLALQATFGDTVQGPLAELVVRSWGALVALVGAMLVYGAYHPAQRALVLVVAGVSKLVFVGLVLAQGSRYLGSAGPAIAMDALFVLVFANYLWAVRHSRPLAIV